MTELTASENTHRSLYNSYFISAKDWDEPSQDWEADSGCAGALPDLQRA